MIKYISLSITFSFLMIFSALSNAQSSDEKIIWQDNENIFIKLTNDDGDSTINNDHPVDLDESKILSLLSAIQVVGKSGKHTPLFTPEQQNKLAKHVAAGLRIGRADQDIVFALQREERLLAGLKTDHYFVAGRVFYTDDQLNLIVGDYERARNRAYEIAYDPTNRGLVKYNFNLGSREAKKFAFDRPLHFTTANIKMEQSANRSDWLQIDVNNAVVEAVTAPANVSAPVSYGQEVRPVQPASKNAAPAKPAMTNQLVERFKTLEALKNNGLITEEEYKRKRQELLNQL